MKQKDFQGVTPRANSRNIGSEKHIDLFTGSIIDLDAKKPVVKKTRAVKGIQTPAPPVLESDSAGSSALKETQVSSDSAASESGAEQPDLAPVTDGEEVRTDRGHAGENVTIAAESEASEPPVPPNEAQEPSVAEGVTNTMVSTQVIGIKKVDLSLLVRPPHEDTIVCYAEASEQGDKLPNVTIAYDPETGIRHLVDGGCRFEIHKRNGETEITANVITMSKKDALWFALGANSKHGRQMSREEKRTAIKIALQAFPHKSANEIAKHIGCSTNTVLRVKEEISCSNCTTELQENGVSKTDDTAGRVIGSDGKSYLAKKVKPAKPTQGTLKQEASPVPIPTQQPASTEAGEKFNDDAQDGVDSGQMCSRTIAEIEEIIAGMEKLPRLLNSIYSKGFAAGALGQESRFAALLDRTNQSGRKLSNMSMTLRKKLRRQSEYRPLTPNSPIGCDGEPALQPNANGTAESNGGKLVASAKRLANTLAPLQYGVPKMPTLRQSDCVVFFHAPTGNKAFTFSGDVFAITNCDFPIMGAVVYKQIIDVLRKYGEAEVEIEVDDTETALIVKKGKSKTKLPYEPTILLDMTSVVPPNPNAWKELPDSFATAVNYSESVATKTKQDEVLSSINITGKVMEAASTAQVIRYQCALDVPHRFLIRSGILGGLLKTMPEQYQVQGDWFILKSAAATFAIPAYQDAFVDDLDSYLAPGANPVTFPTELLEDIPLIRRVFGRSKDVNVSIKDGKCSLWIKGMAGEGEHKAEVDMVSAIDVEFAINLDMFEHILRESLECYVDANVIRGTTNENINNKMIVNLGKVRDMLSLSR